MAATVSRSTRTSRARPCPAFGFSDYEWVLAFEADSLDRLEGVMHAQRYTEARLYVREDTPFFTGPRVSLGEWAERQPRA